jgi:hypothetical protein
MCTFFPLPLPLAFFFATPCVLTVEGEESRTSSLLRLQMQGSHIQPAAPTEISMQKLAAFSARCASKTSPSLV